MGDQIVSDKPLRGFRSFSTLLAKEGSDFLSGLTSLLSSKRVSLGLGVCFLLGCLWWSIPGLNVDRAQEGLYLGRPFGNLQSGSAPNLTQDPFTQNGALAVIPPAWIYLHSGSLFWVRIYFSLFSALAFFCSHQLLKHVLFEAGVKRPNWPLCHLMMTAVWLSMPILMTYSIQTNGTLPGISAFLLGVLALGKNRYLGAFFFGLAAHLKGQFLGLSFGVLAFVFLDSLAKSHIGENGEVGLPRRLYWAGRESFLFVICFLGAPAILSLVVYWPLGWLGSNKAKLIEMAVLLPQVAYGELKHPLGKLLGQSQFVSGAAADLIRERRADEFSRFGILAWSFVATSFLFCVALVLSSFTRKWPVLRQSSLRVIGFAGVLYWINYLFLYAFPYWYNVLPILWCSIIFVPFCVMVVLDSRKSSQVAYLLAALIFLAIGARSFMKNVPNAAQRLTGTALQDYRWE